MPTIVEDRVVDPKSSRYFPHQTPGRQQGAKNKAPLVQFRREIEKVYLACGGTDGLYAWVQSAEGKAQFYPLILKIMATYELKEVEGNAEPIKVYIYGKEVSVSVPSQASSHSPADQSALTDASHES